jgi:hypothetical protein
MLVLLERRFSIMRYLSPYYAIINRDEPPESAGVLA